MTYLGTKGVITYGYPLLPSGYTNFHTILSFYLRAVPALIFGLNEFSLRLPSAVFGILAIPVTFLFVREVLKNKYMALLSAIIVSLSIWQIEFSREVRWYSEFNFFYLASVYFFYLGFMKGQKPFRVLFIIFMILVTFINSIGFTLIFLFVFLLIYKGFKGFFKKNTIPYLIMAIAVIAAQTIHRNFWKVGISFYASSIQSDNIILRTLGKFFSSPKPFFITTFKDMFPLMFYVFLFGILILVLSVFLKKIRNTEEHYISFKKGLKEKAGREEDINSARAGLPFNISFIYFIFFANTAFLGTGNMYSQQRYIFFGYVYFVICYCWTIFEISRLLSGLIKKHSKNWPKTILYAAAAAAIFFSTASYMNPFMSSKIPFRENGDRVDPNFAFSNSVIMHPDTRGAGNYIKDNLKKGDIVISMDLLNSYPYTQQFDGWLWSGNLVSWQPYHKKDGTLYDYYFGRRVLRNESDFLELEGNDLWIQATRSKNISEHISLRLSEYLNSLSDSIVFTGEDGENTVYKISAAKAREAVFYFTDIVFSQEEAIELNEYFKLDFSLDENSIYLKHGWAKAEPQGRWAHSRISYLFVIFNEKKDFTMDINSKALFLPGTFQKASVYLDNILIGEIEYNDNQIISSSFVIPKDLIKKGENATIKFLFKYTVSPSEIDKNSDDLRNLSVFFKDLIIK